METRDKTPGYLAAFRVMDQLLRLMERRGLKKTDLAKRLGVKRPAVTKWFAPGRNLTIFTAAAIAEALGSELRITVVDKASSGSWPEDGRHAVQRIGPVPTISEPDSNEAAVHGTASFARTRGQPRMRATEFACESPA